MNSSRLSLSGTLCAAAALGTVYSFLLLPIVVVALVSFTPGVSFIVPVDGLSLRWYGKLFALDSFWRAFLNSTGIAVASATISLVACTAACFGLARYRPAWARSAIMLLTAPLMFPGLVLGISLLQYFRLIGIDDPMTCLLLAHITIMIPFFVRSLLPAFAGYDFDVYSAALCLGARPMTAVRKVVLPVIAPGVVGGVLFAFFVSFENYSISIFLTDARFKTVPIQMLLYIDESPDPSLAALSVFLIVKTLVLLLIVDRLFGIREV